MILNLSKLITSPSATAMNYLMLGKFVTYRSYHIGSGYDVFFKYFSELLIEDQKVLEKVSNSNVYKYQDAVFELLNNYKLDSKGLGLLYLQNKIETLTLPYSKIKEARKRLTRNEQENGCAPNAQRLSRAQPLLVR
jgi:hypothetical protein